MFEFCAIANDRATRKNSSVKLALMEIHPICESERSKLMTLVFISSRIFFTWDERQIRWKAAWVGWKTFGVRA
ncbi:MAG: hypothetical protein DMG79_21760 [Acidobacteria bacterium]|nr:MAG: hypothetical protein DMG79_21760 [Acidobacteriota bacterium]